MTPDTTDGRARAALDSGGSCTGICFVGFRIPPSPSHWPPIAIVAAVFWNIDVFDIPSAGIIGIAHNEIGEVAIALLLVTPAFVIDRLAP